MTSDGKGWFEGLNSIGEGVRRRFVGNGLKKEFGRRIPRAMRDDEQFWMLQESTVLLRRILIGSDGRAIWNRSPGTSFVGALFAVPMFRRGGWSWDDTHFSVSRFVSGEPWRALTATFLHESPRHFVSTLDLVVAFGPLIESQVGSWALLLDCGILAVLTKLLRVGLATAAQSWGWVEPFFEEDVGADTFAIALKVVATHTTKVPTSLYGIIPISSEFTPFLCWLQPILQTVLTGKSSYVRHSIGVLAGLALVYAPSLYRSVCRPTRTILHGRVVRRTSWLDRLVPPPRKVTHGGIQIDPLWVNASLATLSLLIAWAQRTPPLVPTPSWARSYN